MFGVPQKQALAMTWTNMATQKWMRPSDVCYIMHATSIRRQEQQLARLTHMLQAHPWQYTTCKGSADEHVSAGSTSIQQHSVPYKNQELVACTRRFELQG